MTHLNVVVIDNHNHIIDEEQTMTVIDIETFYKIDYKEYKK